jgi:hypothetical protein
METRGPGESASSAINVVWWRSSLLEKSKSLCGVRRAPRGQVRETFELPQSSLGADGQQQHEKRTAARIWRVRTRDGNGSETLRLRTSEEDA